MQITRENKLALVVGFALILFVGILISDHFSTARNQASADLAEQRPNDPLVDYRRSNPNLIEMREPQPPPPAGIPATNTTRTTPRPEERPPAPRSEPDTLEMGGHQFVIIDEPAPQDPPFVFHDVARGETLSSIARRYYGDESFAKALAEFNNISDPNTLRINHRLRIPAAESLGAAPAPQQPSATPPRNEPSPQTTYTVRAGDSLSDIAQRLLGTSRRWREIYELNRDAIADPDNVQVGTVLKIPRR